MATSSESSTKRPDVPYIVPLHVVNASSPSVPQRSRMKSFTEMVVVLSEDDTDKASAEARNMLIEEEDPFLDPP